MNYILDEQNLDEVDYEIEDDFFNEETDDCFVA